MASGADYFYIRDIVMFESPSRVDCNNIIIVVVSGTPHTHRPRLTSNKVNKI